jgi:L-arabinokinase
LSAKPKIAVYLSSHGYGHTIRTGAILEKACGEKELSLHVMGSAPGWLWPKPLKVHTDSWTDEPSDVGAVQTDDVTVDRRATQTTLEMWREGYDALVGREAERLRDGFDLVVGDVPPLAFDAAYKAGVDSVAVANFSWDWIYDGMGFTEAAEDAARAYAKAGRLVEVAPSAPMLAFVDRVRLGLVGRRAPSRERARALFDTRPDESLVLLAFRAAGEAMVRLPIPARGIKYIVQDLPAGREDVIELPPATTFLDAIGAADAVVAKPGYGILGDVGLNGVRMLYTDRSGFPEDPVLVDWLAGRPGCARVSPQDLATGQWSEPLESLLQRPAPPAETDGATKAAAAAVLERLS